MSENQQFKTKYTPETGVLINLEKVEKVREEIFKLKEINPDSKAKLLLIKGSSSFSIEFLLRAVVRANKSLLILDAGNRGGRVQRIASYLNIPSVTENIGVDPVEDLRQLESRLQDRPQISTVILTGALTNENQDLRARVADFSNKLKLHYIIDQSASPTLAFGGKLPVNCDYIIDTLPKDFILSDVHGYIIADPIRIKKLGKQMQHSTIGPY